MKSTQPSASRRFNALLVLGVMALVSLGVGCATNPVTGKNEFLITSQEREIRTGNQHFHVAKESQGGILSVNPELSAYVSRVGARIVKSSDRPDLPYEFVVINSSQPHAWALPGGKIAVTRGLLVLLENEGQLAAVLSHQVVHTAAKHRAKKLERGTMKTVGLTTLALGATMVGVPILPAVALMTRNGPTHHWLVHSPHSESEEIEADRYGMEYMARAGYDPDHTLDTLRLLGRRETELTPEQEELSLFVAHPLTRKRVASARIGAYQREQTHGPALPEPEDGYGQHIAWLKETAPGYAAADASRMRLIEGDHDSALVLIREARQQVPGEPSFHESEGDILMMQARFHEAFESYDQAIRLRPERASAWIGRGMARKALGDWQNALVDFEISYRIFPNRIAARELAGYVPRRAEEIEEPADAADETLQAKTGDEAEGNLEDPDSPAFAAHHDSNLAETSPALFATDPAREEPPPTGAEATP